MLTFSVFGGAAVLAVLLILFARAFGRNYLRYRGERVIECPENHRPAGIRVNATHVLFSAMEGRHDLRLSSCSRWPERQSCGQQCLTQVEASPEDCLVRNILLAWYRGKDCALCGKPIGEINWPDHKPALLGADRKTVEWRQIAPQDLADTLATHQPVCWNCLVVNEMVTGHADLLIDRSRQI